MGEFSFVNLVFDSVFNAKIEHSEAQVKLSCEDFLFSEAVRLLDISGCSFS